MNKELEKYFKSLKSKYKDKVIVVQNDINNNDLDQVPEVLHSLYKSVLKVDFPFGRILTIEEAVKESEKSPFKSNWFVFGKDNYFSFWLCSFDKDEEGLSFTYWDHESGEDIDGAICKDIISFLKEVEEDYEEYINS